MPGAENPVRTVVIRYRVPNGLKFWQEYEELYWNVTGDEWEIPIRVATATILLPPGLDGLRTASWTGGYGATEDGARATTIEDGFYFDTMGQLGYREGVTVAVAWNPGVLSRPSFLYKTVLLLKANWLLLLPILSLGFMWKTWHARGRDPRRLPIAPQYDSPDGLTPAQAGTLLDNRPDMGDITAALVDLAVRGFVRIEEVEESGIRKWFASTDYRIVRVRGRDSWDEFQKHERRLLKGVFGSRKDEALLSDLQAEFYTQLPEIKSAIYEELMDRGYYTHRPDKTMEGYMAGVVVVLVVGLAGGVPLAADVAVHGDSVRRRVCPSHFCLWLPYAGSDGARNSGPRTHSGIRGIPRPSGVRPVRAYRKDARDVREVSAVRDGLRFGKALGFSL